MKKTRRCSFAETQVISGMKRLHKAVDRLGTCFSSGDGISPNVVECIADIMMQAGYLADSARVLALLNDVWREHDRDG